MILTNYFSKFQQLQLKEGTYLLEVFKKPPVEVLLRAYIFNVTNAEEFMNGKDSNMNVTEVGPYVFQ